MTEPTERFGLTWPGRQESLRSLQSPSSGALAPTDDGAGPHVLIEGDNLEVLKLLHPAYTAAVTLIYLDPPYNTGHDFVYVDDFTDPLTSYLQQSGQLDQEGRRVSAAAETSGRWHSRWLSMMLPRLTLARDLLAPEGALYVSIDEHEVAHLRLLLDEVFGADNFVAQIAVSLNPKGRQLGRHFATSHEYLLVYARDIDQCALTAATTESVNASDFPKHDEQRGLRYRLLPLRNTNKRFNPATAPTMHFPVWGDLGTGQVRTEPFEGALEIRPVFGDGTDAVWRWSRPKIDAQPDDLLCRLVRGRDSERADVFQKDWLTQGRTKKLKTVWTADEAGTTDQAVAELKQRVGHVFETPKPLKLMRRILATMPTDALVLDPFAGSGTLGEAVVAANAEDGGSRRFICVNLPAATPPDSNARAAGYGTVADILRARLAPVTGLRCYRLAPSAFVDAESLAERTLVASAPLVSIRASSLGATRPATAGRHDSDVATAGPTAGRVPEALAEGVSKPRPPTRDLDADASASEPAVRRSSSTASASEPAYRDHPQPTRELDPHRAGASRDAPDQRIVAEILLREGVRLDVEWQHVDLGGVGGVVADGVCVVPSTTLDVHRVAAALAHEPRVLVLLEDAFVDADALRLSAVAAAARAGVTLKTV